MIKHGEEASYLCKNLLKKRATLNHHLYVALNQLNQCRNRVLGIITIRGKEALADPHYTFVLVTLHDALVAFIENMAGSNNLEDVEGYIQALNNLTTVFNTFVTETEKDATKYPGRVHLKRDLFAVKNMLMSHLRTYQAEIPLEESIDLIATSSMGMHDMLRDILLGIILIKPTEAAAQSGTTVDKTLGIGGTVIDEVWKNVRLSQLYDTINVKPDEIETFLATEKIEALEGYGGQKAKEGKGRLLYANPFYDRYLKLTTELTKTKEGIYFSFLLYVFSDMIDKETSGDFKNSIQAYKQIYLNLSHQRSFSLLYNLLPSFKAKSLQDRNASEWQCIETLVMLYLQSYHLANFMKHLKGFLRMTGRIGLCNANDLHASLQLLIQQAFKQLSSHMKLIENMLPSEANQTLGMWYSELYKMMDELKSQYYIIHTQSLKFNENFQKISDIDEIQKDYEAQKQQLLSAATCLGMVCNFHDTLLDAMKTTIQQADFAAMLNRTNPYIRNSITPMLLETSDIVEKMRHDLVNAEQESQDARTQLELIKTTTKKMNDELQQAQLENTQLKQIVEEHVSILKQEIKKMQEAMQSVMVDANALIQQITTIDIKDTQKQQNILQKFHTIKTFLIAQQASYHTLIHCADSLIEKYHANCENHSKTLLHISSIQKQVAEQVTQLLDQIRSLESIISKLHTQIKEMEHRNKEHVDALEKRLADMTAQKKKTAQIITSIHVTEFDAGKLDDAFYKEFALLEKQIQKKQAYMDSLKKWLLTNPKEDEIIALANYIHDKKDHILKIERYKNKGQFSNQTKSMAMVQGLLTSQIHSHHRYKLSFQFQHITRTSSQVAYKNLARTI